MGFLPDDYYDNTLSSSTVSKTTTPTLAKDYLIDFSTGYLVVSDSGQFTICTGLRALVMKIWRKLFTPKGIFLIYDSDYGSKLASLQGMGKVYVDSYISTVISNAIVDGTYVTAINNLKTSLVDGLYNVTFQINTIYGNTSEELNIDLETGEITN